MSTPVDAAAAVENAALKERVVALAAVTLTDAVCPACEKTGCDCKECNVCEAIGDWSGHCHCCGAVFCDEGCEENYLLTAYNVDTEVCDSCAMRPGDKERIEEAAALKSENAALKERVAALEAENAALKERVTEDKEGALIF